MISNEMTEKLNIEFNREIYSGYLYLAMSSCSLDFGLPGFANWFYVQMQEELTHSQKVYNYLHQHDAKVNFFKVVEPPNNFSSPANLFEETLKHEVEVTKFIYTIVKLAKDENDFATENFLQWFVKEQVEEESNTRDILQTLKIVGNDSQSLLMLDQELSKRVFVNTAITV